MRATPVFVPDPSQSPRCSCHMTYLVRVFGVDLPEATGGRLAERAGLERLWSQGRGSLMAWTGR